MTFLYLLTAVVCASYVLLMLRYIYGWKKTASFKPWAINHPRSTFVSIIIPARNEEQNIVNCLSAIFKQTYPSNYFEVIVVDDHSADRTADLVRAQKSDNLKLVSLAFEQAGKKQAITAGVKYATGTLIITTDADCEMGEDWLTSLVSFYEEKGSKMIVAPVLIKGESGAQQIIQSQEMTVLAACACGSIFYNKPILCSGANLAYEKRAFFAINGYEGVDKIASGDDMFLMLKIHKKFPGKISYLKSQDAVVFTRPEKAPSDALKQRKRWASKTFSFGFSHVTGIAALVFLTNFLIVFSGIMSAINLKFVFVPLACFSAKMLVDFMLLYSASSFFEKKAHPIIFALASVVYPVYVIFTGLISPFTRYSWKSRTS